MSSPGQGPGQAPGPGPGTPPVSVHVPTYSPAYSPGYSPAKAASPELGDGSSGLGIEALSPEKERGVLEVGTGTGTGPAVNGVHASPASDVPALHMTSASERSSDSGVSSSSSQRDKDRDSRRERERRNMAVPVGAVRQ